MKENDVTISLIDKRTGKRILFIDGDEVLLLDTENYEMISSNENNKKETD